MGHNVKMPWMMVLWWRTEKKARGGQNVYSNLYSQAVTHPSTNRSQPSVIGRELVYSRWYGRRHKHYERILKWSTKLAVYDSQSYRGLCTAICEWALSPGACLCKGSTVRDSAEPTLGRKIFFDSTVSVIDCPWMKHRKIFHFGPTWTSKAKNCKMSTATCIPRRSPIQVLTGLNLA